MTNNTTDHRALILAYLSGNASQSEVEAFNRLMANDANFSKLFEQLERETVPDLGEIEPVAPPEGLLGDILAEIHGETAEGSAEVVDFPALSTAGRKSTEAWRALAVASSLIAAVSIGLHFVPAPSENVSTQSAPGVAVLAGDTAPSLLVIVYDVDEQKILARLSNTELPEDAVWQLWLIREGVDVPLSLGLLDETNDAGAITLQIGDALTVGEDVLAISLEPLGGSPQAGPSGPVLYSGKVEAL